MYPVVAIIGPTAVGKTAVAMALQDALGGRDSAALISADSAMVYRGMDIGSAKPSAVELQTHPHELIDVRDPWQPYNVADFVEDADEAVRRHLQAGRMPILVGGTMLYVKRFVEGIAKLPSADAQMRAVLQQELRERGGQALHAELRRADPQAAAQIHPHNPQRLLRALEVIRLTGRPMSEQWREAQGEPAEQRVDRPVTIYAIEPEQRTALHARIEARFEQMLELGFLDEVRWLYAELQQRGLLDANLPAARAVGYRQGLAHLAGLIDQPTFRLDAVTATRRLAKRQLTWMRQWAGLKRLSWGNAEALAAGIVADLASK